MRKNLQKQRYKEIQEEIKQIDKHIIELLGIRRDVGVLLAHKKMKQEGSMKDTDHDEGLIEGVKRIGNLNDVPEDLVEKIYQAIISANDDLEKEVFQTWWKGQNFPGIQGTWERGKDWDLERTMYNGDMEIVQDCLARRRQLSAQLGIYKDIKELPTYDKRGQEKLLSKLKKMGEEKGVSAELIENVYRAILDDDNSLQLAA